MWGNKGARGVETHGLTPSEGSPPLPGLLTPFSPVISMSTPLTRSAARSRARDTVPGPLPSSLQATLALGSFHRPLESICPLSSVLLGTCCLGQAV